MKPPLSLSALRLLFLGTLVATGIGLPACEPSCSHDLDRPTVDLAVRRLAVTCAPHMEVYPIAGPHNGGYDSNALSYTCHPHPGSSPDNTDWSNGVHLGNDLFAAKGTPVVSPVDGVIVHLGYTSVGGNRVTVQDDCGWSYYHAHLDVITPGLSEGMSLTVGQSIGTVGNTGNAINTSPHVHFSIYPDGDYNAGVDPFPYLEAASEAGCDGGTTNPVVPDPEVPDDPAPVEPLVTLWAELLPPAGQAPDFRPEGSSEGVYDLYEGQSATYAVWVHNDAESAAALDVIVSVDFSSGGLAPRSWAVYSDYPALDQTTWTWNDANEHPSNPSPSSPPMMGSWHLYALSAGETKRLVFEVDAESYSIGAAPRSEVRTWVRQVADWYGTQSGWDDPVELNLAGELLRQSTLVDVYSEREWHFEGPEPDETEGWTGLDEAQDVVLSGGALNVTLGGESTSVQIVTASFDASVYSGVRLELTLPIQGEVRLSFATDIAPDFDADRSIEVTVPGDGTAHILEAYLGDIDGWAETITALRLDLPPTGAGQAALDFVEAAIVAAPQPAEPGVVEDEGEGPEQDPPGEPGASAGSATGGARPGGGPCIPGNVTPCEAVGVAVDCGLGVMTCLEGGMWGLCLSATSCGEDEDEERPASSVDEPASVSHVGQSISVQEAIAPEGCAGGGGGGPVAPLVLGLALLWRRRRALLLPLLAVGLVGCSAGDGALGDSSAVPAPDGQGLNYQTSPDVVQPADIGSRGSGVIGSSDTNSAAGPDGAGADGGGTTEPPGPEPTTPCATPESVGCGCADDTECAPGLTCLGSLCAPPCGLECPAEWVCVPSLNACVPPHAMLCAPCLVDADCLTPEATCVSLGVAGSYCGTPCLSNSECPEGFACQALGTGAGAPKRCLPPGEACGCSGLAKEQGAATGCFVEVGGALCAGTRSCGPGGLDACQPTGEEGADCGGDVTDPNPDPDPDPDPEASCDEVDCDDGNICTNDLCNAGECSYLLNSNSCEDGDACTKGDQCSNGLCIPGGVEVEVCNGVDDDCDGATDEALTQACQTSCGVGTEICASGEWAGCSAPAVLCDPTEACCGANGCAYVSAGSVCGTAPQTTSTVCDGACGGDVVLKEVWSTCGGASAQCGAGGTTTLTAGVNQSCQADALCVETAGAASCASCDFGCDAGECSAPQETAHVVCIDPGYGGTNSGPQGSGTTGAEVTWSLAMHLVDWLAADTADPSGGAAWEVILTRGESEDPEWADRSAACNNGGAERLLAIYTNAFNGAADGSETHFRSEDGVEAEQLANFVQSELLDHGGLDDRGVIADTWFILSGTDAPGAMSFVGFLDNAGDGAQMANDAWRQDVAEGFMNALQQAFGGEVYSP